MNVKIGPKINIATAPKTPKPAKFTPAVDGIAANCTAIIGAYINIIRNVITAETADNIRANGTTGISVTFESSSSFNFIPPSLGTRRLYIKVIKNAWVILEIKLYTGKIMIKAMDRVANIPSMEPI